MELTNENSLDVSLSAALSNLGNPNWLRAVIVFPSLEIV
jgi:hypothetical protein